MTNQKLYELEELKEKIEALQNELRPLLKKRRQIKRNIFRDQWRIRKKKEKK